jgi:hypothetical protein
MHDGSVNSRIVADGSLRLMDLSPAAQNDLKGDPGADATALWAVVTDGAFHQVGDPVDEFHGSGIVSVTRSESDSSANVFYDLTFNQDIESCAVLATLINSPAGGSSTVIRADSLNGAGAVARVRAIDNIGGRDASFYVAVFC